MPSVFRNRVVWTGSAVVGTGLSTFYMSTIPAAGDSGDILAFFNSIKATFPSGITWTVSNSWDQMDAATGVLEGGPTSTGGGSVASGGVGVNFVQGAGGRVVWNTTGIFKGRRVKGSTFLCPLVLDYWEGANAISSVPLGTWSTAATALLTAIPTLCVWSRPSGGVQGQVNPIASVTVPDKVSWLRSRRT